MNNDSASQVDLRRMRTVIEVARAEAITTAAQTLGVTQSAVSRTVAELEHALGQRLFERLPRGIQLTDAGRRFIERAGRVLADVDDLVAEISETRNRVTGRLRLGIAATGTHAAAACAAFAHEHPDVAIETLHASDQALCPRLLRGELDMIIGSSGYLKRWRKLEVTALTRLHFACMVRPDHPLARTDLPTEVEVLGYPVILPESVEPGYLDIAQRYVHHGLPSLKPQYVTNSLELMLSLVRTTDAFLPIMHPHELFGGLDGEFLLLRDVVIMPEHHIGFARVEHGRQKLAVDVFEQFLIDSLGASASPEKAELRI